MAADEISSTEFVHEQRVIFTIATKSLGLPLAALMRLVRERLAPERTGEELLTSWYVENSFVKDTLEVLVHEFCDGPDTEFRFELWPQGAHSADEVGKLRQWVAVLSKELDQRRHEPFDT